MDENLAISIKTAINASESVLSIIPITESFFYPFDDEENIICEKPSNYYEELLPFYDLVYRKDIKDSIFGSKPFLIAMANVLRISFECDPLLLHVGVTPPSPQPLQHAKKVTGQSSANQKQKLFSSTEQSHASTSQVIYQNCIYYYYYYYYY